MRFPYVVLLSACALTLVLPLVAQSPNGVLNGIVVDASNSAIVGADVIAQDDTTGVQYSTKTNGEGIYVLPNLPPRTYRLQVSKFGFKTIIKPDIVVHVQDALALNFTLPIGATAEVVTVMGGEPLLNTENAAVSTVIDRSFVESLPLNGRSFNTLLQLTPGVVIAPSTTDSPGQFSIAGQRTNANNFTVDGVSANFGAPIPGFPGQAGTGASQAFSVIGSTSSLVSVDALQEFRIETSSFAPEFGRTPGGQVVLTTRSGTNALHGGVFDYFRNTVMDANDWFANQAGKPRAPEHHNDFGGFLGGPILKDNTFFFFSYEGARLDQPQTTNVLVPSAYARSVASSTTLPYLEAYPEPTDLTVTPGVFTALFSGTYSNRATLDAASLRIDHTFNSRFSVFARYNYAPSETLQRQNSLSNLVSTNVDTQTLTLGLVMSLGAHISNALHANYSEQRAASSYAMDGFGGASPFDPRLLLGSLSPVDNVGLFETFDGTAPYFVGAYGPNGTRQFNFTDDFGVTEGAHQFKFGGDYRAIFLTGNEQQHQIIYVPSSIQSYANTSTLLLLGADTFRPAQFLTQAFSLYSQDTWKATARLTLTYGFRWELNPPPSGRNGTTLAAFANIDNPSETTLAGPEVPLWATTHGNVAPRVGVAYSLNSKSNLILRAGGGVFYDLGVGSAQSLSVSFPNIAFLGSFSVPVPIADIRSFLPTISSLPPYPRGVRGFSPNLKLPRSYQWNVALEKLLSPKQVLTATYVGQLGRSLLRDEALLQPNANFTSDLLLTVNGANSNYHALQLQYRRPAGSRLQMSLNFSWAHSLDNASNDVVAGLSSTIISAASDYASSDFDVRQSFSAALRYSIPQMARTGIISALTRDWWIDSVIVARTGFPFNAVISSTSPDQGGFVSSRPDRVQNQPLYSYGSACAAQQGKQCPGGKALNVAAFSVPSTIRQGTEGRNDIPGFGLTQLDLSLGRSFRIAERFDIQLRSDAFNVFNHPNFANPGAFVESGTFFLQSQSMLNQRLGGLNPLFQQGGPRQLQISLKLSF